MRLGGGGSELGVLDKNRVFRGNGELKDFWVRLGVWYKNRASKEYMCAKGTFVWKLRIWGKKILGEGCALNGHLGGNWMFRVKMGLIGNHVN